MPSPEIIFLVFCAAAGAIVIAAILLVLVWIGKRREKTSEFIVTADGTVLGISPAFPPYPGEAIPIDGRDPNVWLCLDPPTWEWPNA